MDVQEEPSKVQYSKDTATFKLHGIGNSMLHNLNKMRNDGLFCDLSLKNKKDPKSKHFSLFKAHACVLAANSQLFYDILSPDTSIKEIHLELFSDPVLELCISLIYGELVDVPLNYIDDLKVVAESLGITSLIKTCDEILEQIKEKQIKEEKIQDSHPKDNESDEWASKLASESMLVSVVDEDKLPIDLQSSLSTESANGSKKGVKTDSLYASPKKKVKVSFDDKIGDESVELDQGAKEKNQSKAKARERPQTKSVSVSKVKNDLYCDHCDRFFSNSNTLRIHRMRIESATGSNPPKWGGKVTSENDLHCSHCDRYFANFRNLQVHKQRVAQSKNPKGAMLTGRSEFDDLSVSNLRCNDCNREFLYHGHLQRHKAICGKNANVTNLAESDMKSCSDEDQRKNIEGLEKDSSKSEGMGKSESDPNYENAKDKDSHQGTSLSPDICEAKVDNNRTDSATHILLASGEENSESFCANTKGNNEENDTNDQTHDEVMLETQQHFEETTEGNSTVEKNDESLYCDHCERFFANKFSLKTHLKRVEEADDPNRNSLTKNSSKVIPYSKEQVYCDHCDSYFANPGSLKSHKNKVALSKDPYNYRLMSKRATPESKIQFSQGFPKKEVYCDHCDRVFATPISLLKHKKRVGEAENPESGRLTGKSYSDVPYTFDQVYCDHCDGVFRNPGNLRIHKRRVQMAADPLNRHLLRKKPKSDTKPAEEEIFCDHCDRKFGNQWSLKAHKKRIELSANPYKRSLTGRKMTRAEIRAYNKKKYREPSQCELCGEVFNTRFKRESHMVMVHEKKYYCKLCDKYWVSKQALDEHLRRHTGEKPYLCSKCEFRAVTSSEIKIHEDLHHGSEMFVCKDCGKLSKSLRALRCHQRQAHGDRRVKAHNEPCPICKRVFSRRNHFIRHMLHVHNIDPPRKNRVMLRNNSGTNEEETEFAPEDDFFQEEVSLDADAQESAQNTAETGNVLESGTNEFHTSGLVLTSENETIPQNFEVQEVADQEYVMYVSEEQFQSLLLSQQK